MKDKLKYKEFIGTVHYSADDEVFFGRIEGINDLVTFEGSTVVEIKQSFEEAVEDYIEICNNVGKEIFKTFKGSFNVRINPELHSKAFEQAVLEGKSLNELVKEAIEQRVKSK